MKNSEWGAISYLGQSKYGLEGEDIYINNFTKNNSISTIYAVTGYAARDLSTNPTGDTNNVYRWTQKNGQKASCTGTVNGVYDMAGGAQELIMLTNKNNISFLDEIDSKYYDVFNSTNQLGWIQYQEEITDITTEQLWITAGATNTEKDANIFKTSYYDGNSQTDTTFRIVLS